MRWKTLRRWLSRWAADTLLVVLALLPLPAQLASRQYQASYLLSAAFFLALLGRRRFPVAAVIVAVAGRAVLTALPPYGSQPAAVIGQLLLMFVIAGSVLPEWVAWAGWGGDVAIVAAKEFTGQPRSDYGWSDFLITAGLASVLFGATLVATRRTRAHQEIAEQARRAEADRARSAAEAAAAERARITREMHDVVAHSLTVAVVQCVAAADDLESGSGDRAAIGRRVRAAEGACRDALDELRRMLGVLRFGTEPLAPAPRLADLANLVSSVGETGVEVELSLDEDLAGLPPGVELTCYRIVQEALTNTIKHSGATRARVSVSRVDGEVRVRVSDDGTGTGMGSEGTGQGLIGMRERAAAYGGTLAAGPSPAGGYLVEAVVPRGQYR